MKRVSLLLLLLLPFTAFAQFDGILSQYQFNQHVFNPAYTGIHDIFQVNAGVRAQWTGIEGAPVTSYLDAHTSFGQNRNSVGMTILNDRIGINDNYEFFASYAFKIDNQRSKLSIGIQGGVQVFSYDYDELETDFDDDFLLRPVEENFSKPNFGFGIFYSRANYYLGLSAPKLLLVEVDDVDLNGGSVESEAFQRHYYFSGGYVFDQLGAVIVKPSVLVRYVEDIPISVDVNVDLLLNERLWLGTTLRNTNAVGVRGTFLFKQNFRAGYSFEIPINGLVSSQFGTHEIGLSFDFGVFSQQAVAPRYY